MLKKLMIFFAFLLIAGCANKAVTSDACRQLLFQHSQANKLQGEGVQVIRVGDEVSLFLPANRFFYPQSNHLRNNVNVLKDVIVYINSFPVENIEVKGFTTNDGDYSRNLALSRAQAEAIAAYLWKHGLDARLISANGLGCHHPYEMNGIEIFFRVPPPDNVFH